MGIIKVKDWELIFIQLVAIPILKRIVQKLEEILKSL